MVGAIIVGGGKSSRFGEDKISYLIDDKPLIYYTALPFIKSDFINEIVVVLSKDNYKKIKKYFENLKKIKNIVVGGEERKDSVINGLECFLNSNIDKVLIHDGARPIVKSELINKIVYKIDDKKCIVPVITANETIKFIKNKKIKTLNRDSLYITQTPQGFPFPKIYYLYKKYENKKLFDDSMVFELENEEIELINGDFSNIKVTYNNDIIEVIDFIQKNENRYRI
ncbi:MAG TPA: 2-C-methyl-D-erythritol 4-phosphate cytidylyltransferase [Caldisericia bacterium]|nr:2-C-methyl-D-erythritol 4-phosphate cytidylyltransferase [Caldisericia bacterium]